MAEKTKKIVCSICLNDFKNPKLIDCHHTFCFTCLEDYIKGFAINNQFPCPLCRHDVTIPKDGVRGFTSNFYIQATGEESVNYAPEDSVNYAPEDSVNYAPEDSEYYAPEDSEYYAQEDCAYYAREDRGYSYRARGDSRYDSREDRGYSYRARGDSRYDSRAAREDSGYYAREGREDSVNYAPEDMCPSHTRREIKYFCKDCSVAVCSDCFVSSHNGHEFSDLQDDQVQQEYTERMTKLNLDFQHRIKEFELYADSLKSLLAGVDNSAESACKAVDEQVAQICSEAKQAGEDTKLQIQTSRDEERRKLTKPLEETKTFIEQLKDSHRYSADVIEHKSIVHVINRIQDVTKEHEESGLKKMDIPNVKCAWFEKAVVDTSKTILMKQLGALLYQEQSMFTDVIKFDEVREGEVFRGSNHIINGQSWYTYIKKEVKEGKSNLGVYLCWGKKHNINCSAEWKFTLMNVTTSKAISHTLLNYTYTPDGTEGRGWASFLDWDKFADKQHGFLDDNNNFTLTVNLKVTKVEEF